MIDSYEFGKIVLDGKVYTSDLIILPDRIIDKWWREEGHKLSLKDIDVVLAEWPETFVIGTGASGAMQVLPEVRHVLGLRGVHVIIMNTKEACEAYNEVYKTSRTIAALHLTC
jgi:hypothetical protein